MATLCKNCSHALVFDPISQLLECSYCGSSFTPEEVESEAKNYRLDLKAEPINEVYGTEDEKYMDCYVYSCSECGGEIIINGTEASTSCIFCGNPNVVFSSIARQRQPEFIMPFRISKGVAMIRAREAINKGAFVPGAIKKFSVDCCRGIYLPYWIVNATYYGTVIVEGSVTEDKKTVTRYFGRTGYLKFKDLPIDASRALSDDSSSKLEPFDLNHLKPFDEDYLAGFYSNVSDVTYSDVRKVAMERGKEFFAEASVKDVDAYNKTVVDSYPSIDVDTDMKYAMLPAWFISFDFEGKHHTILVNGDTGKVVCALPWKKALFNILLFAIAITATVLSFFVFKGFLTVMFSGPEVKISKGEILLWVFIISTIVTLFSTGVNKIKRVMENIRLTQDKAMFNFMKKRQG